MITAMTFSASGAAPTPLYHLYQERFGLTPATVTVIFAAYVLSLLLALLTTGALSDHVGRRPTVLGALMLNIIAMVMFSIAGSGAALIAARTVQGFAAGVATTALGAAIVDVDRSRGAVPNSVMGFAGLTIGALGAATSQLYHYFEDRDDLVHAVIDATTDAVLGRQDELLDHLDSWAGIDRWFDFMVQHQIEEQARGGCPIGSLAGQLAESDPDARAAIAAGFDRWEAHIRVGLMRMRARGKLRKDADPAALATATMASIQGGLLLTQVRRDPNQLRIALNAARNNLRVAAA